MRPWRRSWGRRGPSRLAVCGAGGARRPLAQHADNAWMRALQPGYAGGPTSASASSSASGRRTRAKGLPTLSPSNLGPMKAAIARYAAIAAKGGWRKLPDVKLQQGSTHPAVGCCASACACRASWRRAAPPSTSTTSWARPCGATSRPTALPPPALLDKSTVAAMNVPAASRLKQLRANLARLGELSKTPRKYIAVNIPAAQIEAVENDAVASRHAGIVGKIDRPTPLLKSAIHELNFNAVWHLPPTVIEKDLIPTGQEMARRGQSVLVKFKIDAYGGDGRKLEPSKVNWSGHSAKGLTYRQQPGPENPLGFVKMNFPNAHSVYMHDTPGQSLFGRSFRAASSGCVRIAGIEALAAWVVAEQGWRPEHVRQMKETGERRDVRLKPADPALFRLHHRLGDAGRRGPLPPRHLQQGRHRRAGWGVLTRCAPQGIRQMLRVFRFPRVKPTSPAQRQCRAW